VPRARKGKPFYTIDCETDPFKPGRVPEPFIWGVYDGQTEFYEEFATAAEVAAFLHDKGVTAYAHNGGKFDYHYMRDLINSDDVVMVISGRLAQFKIGECTYRDSMNILVNPLRAFCKEEIDYTKLEPDVRHLYMDEIRRYLRSDCVNLWNTIQAYFDKYGRTLTQAGASMRYWQKNYQVPWTKQTMRQSEDSRPYYYGGRVECFAQGHAVTPFSVVDINSAYPHAMLKKHPLSPEGISSERLPTVEKMGPQMIHVEGIARGCFPYRNEDGSLFFPHDEKTVREYYITGWELAAALEHDAFKVFRVLDVLTYTQLVDFVDYVNHFYAERVLAKSIGDKVADVFAKLFLNSLYGKFASDPEKYSEYVIASSDTVHLWCGPEVNHLRKSGPPFVVLGPWGDRHLCGRALPEEKHTYYNVPCAASITGYVRSQLFRAISVCEGVLYCDTDSIAARDVSRLRQGGQLGEWKLEAHCDEYAIAGKKLYAFRKRPGTFDPAKEEEWKTASKGVRLEPAEIVKVARGETVISNPAVPCYTMHRPQPTFIPRAIRMTHKKVAPEGESA
jgi:hypothetical protein